MQQLVTFSQGYLLSKLCPSTRCGAVSSVWKKYSVSCCHFFAAISFNLKSRNAVILVSKKENNGTQNPNDIKNATVGKQ